MACVAACPDTAIFARVVPEPASPRSWTRSRRKRARSGPLVPHGRHPLRGDHRKYGDVPARQGHDRGAFGIFVDPVHCKGCSECVEVCAALGHDALIMIDKVAEEPTSESTLKRYARDMRFYRTLPPTPEEYRNEKALADLLLGEDAIGYVGGAGRCAGCGEGTALRMMCAATAPSHGDQWGIVAATGCNTVYTSTYPYNPYLVPWTNSLFENAPADAMGVRSRWDQMGWHDRPLWCIGGDGAMFDIGFQSLSRMLASGMNIKVFVLDTQVYSNTGGQASTASYGGQVTKLSAFGKAIHGRNEPRKELGRILMAHGEAYVAQSTPAHLNHFLRTIMEANAYPGPAVVIAYTPCQPEHGIADDASSRQSKLAVESRTFPLFTYDPRRGPTMAERLSLQGNPAIKSDWATAPDGTPIDFLTFARTEGRFAPHFGADGTPTPEILATAENRLAAWQSLQELAGVRG